MLSEAEGEPTLREQEERRERELRNDVTAHPLVRAVLETFPGATIAAVRDRAAASEPVVDEITSDERSDEENVGEEGS
jgi:DNA polymerase-3 subunit gamma/tau